MKYLWVKFRRDFVKLFPQFISVFMMALLSVTIFAGFESTWTGMEHQTRDFYDAGNLADMWVYGKNLNNKAIEKLEGISGVKKATNSMSIVANVVSDSKTSSDVKMMTVKDTSNQNPVVLKGDDFDPEAKGIWIDKTYAGRHNISVGDDITLSFGELPDFIMEIKGLVMSPEFIYYTGSATETMPNADKHGYAYLGEKQMKDMTHFIVFNQARLTLDKNADLDRIDRKADEVLGKQFYCTLDREDLPSTAQTKDEILQTKKMAMLFMLVFVLLALLTMYTSISRLVKNQMIQIGTMKALGVTNGQILRHYMMYGMAPPLLGSLLGVPLGKKIVGNVVMNIKKTTLTLPKWSLEASYGTIIAIVFIVVICTFATIWAARSALKATPAETMRGIDDKSKRRKAKAASAKAARSYAVKWVQRDIGRNKLRYIIGVIGVMGSMMLMIAGFGMSDSINASNSYVFSKQYSYDYIGQIGVFSREIKDAINDSTDSKLQWLTQNAADVKYIGKKGEMSTVISIIEKGPYYAFEKNDSNKKMHLPDEGVVLSAKFAEQIGAKKGDKIKFTVTGISGNFKAEVMEITSVRTPQGIYMSDKAWKDMGEKFEPMTVVMDKTGYKDLKDNDMFSELTSKTVQENNINELSDSVNTVIKILIIASFLLSVVILYNLGMMNYEERYREYATMKVIGYTKREIRNLILTDCMFTIVPGWLIGIPVGFGFLRLFIKVVSFDSYEWRINLLPGHFIMLSLFVILCAVLINLVISRKANNIVMTEALKSVE